MEPTDITSMVFSSGRPIAGTALRKETVILLKSLENGIGSQEMLCAGARTVYNPQNAEFPQGPHFPQFRNMNARVWPS